MRAIVQTKYGSPDELELRDVDPPTFDEDEARVRVRAASLHPDVWHVVTGRPFILRLMGDGFSRPKHPIPGTDMAGVVEAVGAKVGRFRVGDEVFGETMQGHQWTNGGAFAELVSVREEWLAPKPANVSFEQAASVPTAGFIALNNLRGTSELGDGQKVLVNGAGGGVGSIALQILKSCGAHVAAVDSTSKLDLLRSLGADEVIDFTVEDFTRRGVRYDFIFDVPGTRPLSAFRDALTSEGRYVPIGHEGFGKIGNRWFGIFPHFMKMMLLARLGVVKGLRSSGLPPTTRAEAMSALSKLLEEGTLTPVIDSTFPLTDFKLAFRHMIDDELHGKVMLIPTEI